MDSIPPFATIKSDGTLKGTMMVTPDGQEYRLPLTYVRIETSTGNDLGNNNYRHLHLQIALGQVQVER